MSETEKFEKKFVMINKQKNMSENDKTTWKFLRSQYKKFIRILNCVKLNYNKSSLTFNYTDNKEPYGVVSLSVSNDFMKYYELAFSIIRLFSSEEPYVFTYYDHADIVFSIIA